MEMKKILTSIIFAAAVFTSCNDQVIMPKGDGSFAVSVGEIADEYVTKSDVVLDANEFDYIIEGEFAQYIEYREGKIKDMPTVFENVPEGTYTITVSSSETKTAAFDQPIISGTQEFTVKAAEITSVQVYCSIQNVKVTIQPTDEFFTELASYTITVSNGDNAENKLIWTNGELVDASYALLTKDNVLEAKSGYFTVGSALEIYVTGYRTVTEQEAVYEGVISPIAAKDHYIIKLHAQTTGQLGGGESTPGITLTVDNSTNDKDTTVQVPGFELPPVDGPDDPSTGGGEEDVPMSLTWDANPEFDVYELKSTYDDGEVTLKVHADNGIAGFLVKITSPTEGFMSAVQEMATYMDGDVAVLDLFDEGSASVLAGLGLVTGEALRNQTDVDFSIGGLLPMMTGFGPELNSVHTFIMEVTDTQGNVLTQDLKFEYKGN